MKHLNVVNRVHRTLTIASIVICIFIASAVVYGARAHDDCSLTSRNILRLVNQYRSEHSLNTLAWNEKLASSATDKANDLLEKGYWSHFAPDGTSPWDLMIKHQYVYATAGENLARNYTSGCAVVLAWEHSPEHNEVLLKQNVTDGAVAITEAKNNFIVLHVGRTR